VPADRTTSNRKRTQRVGLLECELIAEQVHGLDSIVDAAVVLVPDEGRGSRNRGNAEKAAPLPSGRRGCVMVRMRLDEAWFAWPRTLSTAPLLLSKKGADATARPR